MKELDLGHREWRGHHLVEANAGTGKTYSITAIHLRMILVEGLSVEQVLVMTFTRAATAELKRRLRERLQQARRALTGGDAGDAVVTALVEEVSDRDEALNRVERSLLAFDLAPVLTIHGFCQQVLGRFAFATGWDPGRELVEREDEAIRQLVIPAWDRLSRQFSPGFAATLRRGRNGIGGLVDSIGARIVEQAERPWRKVIPGDVNVADLAAREGRGRALADELAAHWRQSEARIREALSAPGLKLTSYKPHLVERSLAVLAELARQPERWSALGKNPVKDLKRLGRERLAVGTRNGFDPSGHPADKVVDDLVALLDELGQAYTRCRDGLWWELFQSVMDQRETIKRKLDLRTYGDLVAKLHQSLESGAGEGLAEAIREAYPVALVDEFQDTDQLQFDIFQRIYGQPGGGQPGGGRPDDAADDAATTVVFVGDPKQALYGFRGADVYAYLRARDHVDRCWRLSRNWRSRPAVLEGVNALFTAVDRPFVSELIDYAPSQSGNPDQYPPLALDGKPMDGLAVRLRTLPEDENKDAQRLALAAAVAADIAELLALGRTGRAVLEGEPVTAGDVCVLVRKHQEGDWMASALAAVGLGCSRSGRASVWHGDEAWELERLLKGVADCERSERLAAALSTRICGLSAAELDAIRRDEQQADRWYRRMERLREVWREGGVAPLLARVLREFQTSSRWLADRDERGLTNLMHLQDRLVAREQEAGRSMAGLLQWLERERAQDQSVGEDDLLRLESDQNLVQVMTIHAAKGLEFPVVYLPFTWDARNLERVDIPEFHDHRGQATLDLGGPDMEDHKETARAESFAEELRLLYVALTRARHRCEVTWAPHADAAHAALCYLLHGSDGDWRSGLKRFRGMDEAERLDQAEARLEDLGIPALRDGPRNPAMRLDPPDAGPLGVRARAAPARRPRAWQVHSFSSLMQRRGVDATHDRDELLPGSEPPSGAPAEPIYELPAGPTVGLMFHDILENLSSFDPPDDELDGLVRRRVAQFGLDGHWSRVVARQVRVCLRTPLDDGGLTLSALAPGDMVAEMEFSLSLERARLDALSALLRPDGPEFLEDQVLAPGFLRGYIDLVFRHQGRYFVVDYKSNRLGTNLDDYRPEALASSVIAAGYDLQYHLYQLALHRLLAQQLGGYDPAEHLGGVYYLYLRGMREAEGPASGIHSATPAVATLEALDRLFAGDADEVPG